MPRRRSPVDLPPFSDLRNLPMPPPVPGSEDPFALVGTGKPDQPLTPVLLTIDEVAARLRMSAKSVRRRIKDGVIRAAPTGGRLVRISSDEVLRLTAGGPLLEP
jgi:excisionase family DNA binding protein